MVRLILHLDVPSMGSMSLSEHARLQDELSYIRDNHEYSDIASGPDSVINDSIVNEILDIPDDPAAVAQEETQASEPQETSAIQEYLSAALLQIKKDIRNYQQPGCYKRGDFFLRPKHPVFVLHEAAKKGLQPDRLCSRNIFVWLPSYLPGAPDSFKCTCGGHLTKNGRFSIWCPC